MNSFNLLFLLFKKEQRIDGFLYTFFGQMRTKNFYEGFLYR